MTDRDLAAVELYDALIENTSYRAVWLKKPLGLDRERPWWPDVRSVPDMVITGMKGMGKSVAAEAICHYFYKHKEWKVIDLYNLARKEHDWKCMPLNPDDIDYDPDIDTPEAEKIETLIPFVRGKYPKKVPDHYKGFTLPFGKLDVDEVESLLPTKKTLTESHKAILDMAKEKLGKGKNIADLIKKIDSMKKKASSKEGGGESFFRGLVTSESLGKLHVMPLFRALYKLLQDGLVTSENNPLCLDMKKIIEDNKTVTGFNFEYCNQAQKYLTLLHIVKKIKDVKAKLQQPLVLYIREAGDLLHPIPKNSASWYLRNEILELQRHARDLKIMLILDVQSLSWITDDFRRLVSYFIMFKTTSQKDYNVILDNLGEDFSQAPEFGRELDGPGDAIILDVRNKVWDAYKFKHPPHSHSREGIPFEDAYFAYCMKNRPKDHPHRDGFRSTTEEYEAVRSEYGQWW